MFYRRRKVKPKFKLHDLIRTADLNIVFSKGNPTNTKKSYKKLDGIRQKNHNEYLPEGDNEALLKKPKLTLKEKRCYEVLRPIIY